MNLDNVIKIINGVGFPIAMCIVLLWMHNNTVNTQQKLLDDFENTIQNNTAILNKLVDRIERGDK